MAIGVEANATAPFSLPNPYTDPLRRRLIDLVKPVAERLLSLSRLNAMHADLASRQDPRRFEERALEALGVSWRVPDEDVAQIPTSGGLVVVANHPFGGLDGLLLAHLLRRVRPDVKLLGNSLLASVPELRDTLLYVNPFGGQEAANAPAMREAIRWVRDGGALGVFPAGEVSHPTFTRPRVTDPAWDVSIGRLLRLCRAPALAVFFEGSNSPLFHLAGLAHPRLRTLMLPRELLRRSRGPAITVRVGNPVATERIESLGSAERITDYLRARTYILRGRAVRGDRLEAGAASAKPVRSGPSQETIVPPVPVSELRAEIEALPAEAELLRSGDLRVLCARAARIPRLLTEIGRLREVAFRLVGEGTGRSIDLDRHDDTYHHLFVWNETAGEVVGAYRIGPTDEILPRDGVEGLYTSSLFHYRGPLLAEMGPALEMGRSFVRPEYQRHHAPLLLLWKGIGRFVAAHPRYRCLFGTVSISSLYQSMSRSLLLSFLRVHRQVGALARWVRPRNRKRLATLSDPDARLAGAVVSDLAGVDELVREIEADRRAMPVLLRQYLKLNGVMLGFTVDPEFGDVLDGLILVDLTKVDRHILERYMGAEGVRSFLAHHRQA